MLRHRSVLLAACAALLTRGALAQDVGECDAAAHMAVLSPSQGQLDARAAWLDQRTILWPGAHPGAVFRLYFSKDGAISATAGRKVQGAQGHLALAPVQDAKVAQRFRYLEDGVVLAVPGAADAGELLRQQLVLVQEAPDGTVASATHVQHAAALDGRYAAAGQVTDLGVTVSPQATRFRLWAPTARNVAVCTYPTGGDRASGIVPMHRNAVDGTWSARLPSNLSGTYYKYIVDVFVPNTGVVRNRVTDPYSVSLTTNSARSYVADLDSPQLKPAGWDRTVSPATVKVPADMVVYELHVRDFSINDPTVTEPNRGKYTAFTEKNSNGMRHLRALARAGLTDIHLLPVYDLGSVPEKGCAVPRPAGAANGSEQQALLARTRETDCFNWGYDPFHYSAPEGSYSLDPYDGARRIVEFRQMVMALHRAGLRVGMDVVYNHTFRGGQDRQSVLDRIVPGYYHRLDAKGNIETSTCCFNTATENLMMGKLMVDSAALWARHYRIDSFRFDLMGHQPRAAMQALQERVNAAAGKQVQLLGEGWNFGEVADGRRFVQASQLSLGGSGIGTFSDRMRDAVRGGSAGDAGEAMFRRQGYINGLFYAPNGHADGATREELLRTADLVRVGLAGSVRSYPLTTYTGDRRTLEQVDYNGQPAGYASEPDEVVNYVENHDNHTLYDINALKLPAHTSASERARVQVLGAAINAFAQGIAYYHAGIDTLRSKSLDRNSFNSGDWFNRIDWSYRDNYFGTGLPPAEDNGKDFALLKPVLANPAIKPARADIAFARDAFRDLLAIRASSTLFRLRTAADIRQRLRFWNTGPSQEPTLIAAHIDGDGYPGAYFRSVSYFVNVGTSASTLTVADAKGRSLRLHPVQASPLGADKRARMASFDSRSGTFTIPARTAVVFVE